METKEIVVLIFSCLFSSGITVWILDWYSKRGKVVLSDYSVQASVLRKNNSIEIYISAFTIDLLFANGSGNKKIIRNIQFRFFDGKKFMPITQMEDPNISTISILPNDIVKFHSYAIPVTFGKDIIASLGIFGDEPEFLEVTFTVDNKLHNQVIKPWHFKYPGI